LFHVGGETDQAAASLFVGSGEHGRDAFAGHGFDHTVDDSQHSHGVGFGGRYLVGVDKDGGMIGQGLIAGHAIADQRVQGGVVSRVGLVQGMKAEGKALKHHGAGRFHPAVDHCLLLRVGAQIIPRWNRIAVDRHAANGGFVGFPRSAGQRVFDRIFSHALKNVIFVGQLTGVCIQTAMSLPVGVAILVVKEDRIAVNQRIGTIKHRDQWQFPGGTVNPAEPVLTAAQRELGEETGLWLALERFQYLGSDLRTEPYVYTGHAFLVLLEPGENLRNCEPEKHSDWVWVTREELEKLDMLPGTAVYAEQVCLQ